MEFYGIYPLVMSKIAMENDRVIVDLPMKHEGFLKLGLVWKGKSCKKWMIWVYDLVSRSNFDGF